MEAILEYYLEDGHLDSVKNYTDDEVERQRIIYEVIRVIEGVPLFFKEHILRLESSFKLLDKTFSYKYDKIKEYVMSLIDANKIHNGNIKITFDIKIDTMRIFSIKHSYPTDDMYNDGVKTILYHGERHNPNAKVVDAEFRANVTNEIKKRNAFEAILVNNDGYITEGSKSNIFMISENTLYTSPVEDVLPGITRGKIIEVAKSLGIDFKEEKIDYKILKDMNAMFISGTSPNILPISSVEDINLDVNNKVMRSLMKAFDDEIKRCINE